MYTIIQLASILLLIAGAVGGILTTMMYFMEYREAVSEVEAREDNNYIGPRTMSYYEQKVETWKKVVPIFWVCVASIPVALAFIFVSSKKLDEIDCNLVQGTFVTEDNGLVWYCYDAKLVQKDDTRRVIIEEN